jgi:hypothetical protein
MVSALTLWAQAAPPGVSDGLGVWLTIGIYVMGAVYLARQLYLSFNPRRPLGEQYVTRAELSQAVAGLKTDLADFKGDVLPKLKELQQDVAAEIKGLADYTRDAVHRLITSQHTLNVKLAQLLAIQGVRPVMPPTPEGNPED